VGEHEQRGALLLRQAAQAGRQHPGAAPSQPEETPPGWQQPQPN